MIGTEALSELPISTLLNQWQSNASLLGTASLIAKVKQVHIAHIILVNTSTLGAKGEVAHKAKTSLLSASTLITIAIIKYKAKTTLVTSSILVGKAGITYKVNAKLISVFSLTGGIHLIRNAQVTLSVVSLLRGAANTVHKAAIILGSVMTLLGKCRAIFGGNTTFASGSTLEGQSYIEHVANANLVGVSTLETNEELAHFANIVLVNGSNIAAYALPFSHASSFIISNSTLTASAATAHNASVLLIGNSTLTASAATAHNASVLLIGNSTLTASAATAYVAEASMVSTSLLVNLTTLSHNAEGVIGSTSILTALTLVQYGATATLLGNSFTMLRSTSNWHGCAYLLCESNLWAYLIHGNASILGGSTLAGLANTSYSATVAMANSSLLVAIAKKMCNGHAIILGDPDLGGSSMLVAVADVIYGANGNFIGTCQSVVGGEVEYGGVALINSDSNLESVGIVGIGMVFVASSYLQIIPFGNAIVAIQSKSNLSVMGQVIYEGASSLGSSTKIKAGASIFEVPIAILHQSSAASQSKFPFTLTVTFIANSVPTGQVAFYDGSKQLGVATIDVSETAILIVGGVSLGYHTLYANYLGDGFNRSVQTNMINHLVYPGIAVSSPLYVDATCGSTVLINGVDVCFGQSVT